MWQKQTIQPAHIRAFGMWLRPPSAQPLSLKKISPWRWTSVFSGPFNWERYWVTDEKGWWGCCCHSTVGFVAFQHCVDALNLQSGHSWNTERNGKWIFNGCFSRCFSLWSGFFFFFICEDVSFQGFESLKCHHVKTPLAHCKSDEWC